MEIKGTVQNVVFYNQDNGYCVLEVKTDNELLTVVGNSMSVLEGEDIVAVGDFAHHNKFGFQFKATEIKRIEPTDSRSIERYLASGLFKGVGAVTAKAIVDKFGGKTLEIIEKQPQELKKVKGISIRKAMDIGNAYGEIKKMQQQVMFLQKYNISTTMALKIYNIYKSNTQKIVTENPYRLIDDVIGIGFVTADKLARQMGIEADSPFRIRAGVVYVLKEQGEKMGNTYVFQNEVLKRTMSLLELQPEQVENVFESTVDSLILENYLRVFQDDDDRRCLALAQYYHMENNIAGLLVNLKNQGSLLINDISSEIAEFERINNIKLHENQKNAVINAVENNVSLITGGPGTGKTTIVKCMLHIFNNHNLKVELATPTGRAAKRLAQSTGQDAKTIHRLLELNFKSGGMSFYYNDKNPLPCDIVIIDELSMVDIYIMFSLLKAIRSGSKIIMVGDKDQLPSVGAGNVLGDLIHSNLFNVNYLTQIYRQSSESLIITNAHLINNGKMPILSNDNKDFFYKQASTPQDVLNLTVEMTTSRLPKYYNTPPASIQVMAPLKNGLAGVDNINKSLQQMLNPPHKNKPQINIGSRIFRQGDKVMQTINNYQLEWHKKSGLIVESGEGIFNGDIGYIIDIDTAHAQLTVEFDDGRTVDYPQADVGQLILAYAITIHKSQGCEFDIVVLPICAGPYTMLNRNLLYTAVTRAKNVVLLIGDISNISMMVKNNFTVKRQTMLRRFLEIENAKYTDLLT